MPHHEDLEALMKDDLERSGIALADAEYAGMFLAESASKICPDFKPWAGIIIPYAEPCDDAVMQFDRDSVARPFMRVRYLNEPVKAGFVAHKPMRYAQPRHSGTRPYFPITEVFDWADIMDDPDIPIIITEGEKKALAACLSGFPTIGLGGVFNFMAEGEFLQDLERVVWADRVTYICFDSDAAQKPLIQAAEGRLATELSLSRGAVVHLARLPGGVGGKVGLDDYLLDKGADAFENVLKRSGKMRKLDSLVLGLNKDIAWIEKEGCIYEHATRSFISRVDFKEGSKYSALTVDVPTAKGDTLKTISVASSWLKHPHAQRYQEILFRPGEPLSVPLKHGVGTALNMWTGWDTEEGDVDIFLELTEFLLSKTEKECADIVLPTIAYKVQNPMEKVHLSFMFVGEGGSGKSFWGEIVMRMMGQYGFDLTPRMLFADFNGWLETSLVALISEVPGDFMAANYGYIKNLITGPTFQMNEKFRKSRQIDTYTFYIFNSNDRSAAAFPPEDRRMVIIDAPDKREDAFYDRLREWSLDGGPKKLLNYFLNYDLKGWKPPKNAPVTSEKFNAYMESLTPVEEVAMQMKTSKGNFIKMAIDMAIQWADANETNTNMQVARYARDIIDFLGVIRIRPFYTPMELLLLFPSVVEQFFNNKRLNSTPSSELSKELRRCGIRYLQNKDNPLGFQVKGRLERYLVVSDFDTYTKPISQNEFERLMRRAPKYRDT